MTADANGFDMRCERNLKTPKSVVTYTVINRIFFFFFLQMGSKKVISENLFGIKKPQRPVSHFLSLSRAREGPVYTEHQHKCGDATSKERICLERYTFFATSDIAVIKFLNKPSKSFTKNGFQS